MQDLGRFQERRLLYSAALLLGLLHAVPSLVLWQLESHPDAAANLQREAAAVGIDPRRIIFVPKLDQVPYLGRLKLVDLGVPQWSHDHNQRCLVGGRSDDHPDRRNLHHPGGRQDPARHRAG